MYSRLNGYNMCRESEFPPLVDKMAKSAQTEEI